MESNIIKVKTSLVRASKLDLFTSDEIPRENKIFFYRDPITKEFSGVYRISGTDRYDIIELYKLLQLGALYMITENHCENNFCFKLVLKKGEHFNFFDAPKWVKQNVIYYEIKDTHYVVGPLSISLQTDVLRLRKLMADGMLYVPSGIQLFEPYNVKKSA